MWRRYGFQLISSDSNVKVHIYDVCVFLFTIYLNLIKTILINAAKDRLFYPSSSFLYLIFLYTFNIKF